MKWQALTRFVSPELRRIGQRASWAAIGAFATLRFVACSSDGGQQQATPPATAQAVCGNGVVEAGEACDGTVQATCAALTLGSRPTGMVRCTNCQLDPSGCLSAGSGGAPTVPPPGGNVGTGASGGIVVGSGGVFGAGGNPGSGGTFAAGGTPPLGGAGGTPAGGAPAGGAPAGGAPTGGAPTGGAGGAAGAAAHGGSSGVLGDIDALRQTCLDTINMYRATKMLTPLKLAAASVEMCSDMGAQSDATAMVAHQSAGKCGLGAQDTCPGWPPGQYGGAAGALKACLMSMWNEGEPPNGRTQCINDYFAGNIACFEAHGHYLNMSDPANGTVSCGFYVMPNGSLWMNQDLGR